MDKREKALRELAKDFASDLTANGMGDVIQPENLQHKRSTEDFLLENAIAICSEGYALTGLGDIPMLHRAKISSCQQLIHG